MLNTRLHLSTALIAIAGASSFAEGGKPWSPTKPDGALRVASFNVWDMGAGAQDAARTERLAEVIRSLAPDIVLINEIAVEPGGEAMHAEWFALQIAKKYGAPEYALFTAPVNTGVPSGFDLNNDGRVVSEPGSRGYGEDCFGFGEYPGQYGMALLVRDDIGAIDHDAVRTFQKFLWKDMPGAMLPEGW